MTARKPPALAVWLLARLGYLAPDSALGGDLLEEFHAGRSYSWFWRQTVIVLVKGRSPRHVLLRLDLAALFAGAAAQFPVAAVFWRFNVVHRVHGAGWIVLASLALLVGFVLARALPEWMIGRDLKKLSFLIGATGGGPQDRSVFFFARSFENFATFLLCSCVASLFSLRFQSIAELTEAQLAWLGIFTLSVFAGTFVLRAKETAEPKTAPIQTWPPHDLALPVILSDQRIITLLPETALQAVFIAGDKQLAVAIFSRGATAELLHRAIWLASARRWQAQCRGTETPPLPVAALSDLIAETARTEQIEKAFCTE